MKLEDFNVARLREAIRIYLDIAYDGSVVPDKVNEMVQLVESSPGAQLLHNPVLEVEKWSNAQHIFLRLGNRYYPHMKLGIVEFIGHEGEFTLVADTHDKAFAELSEALDFNEYKLIQEKNASIKSAIEKGWAKRGLPTESALLKQKSDPQEQSISSSGATIMIVDDTPVTLKFEASVLNRAGFNVIQCASGHEAVEQARNTHIDLCFMDLMMPGMNGYETIRQLREFGLNQFPIVIATAVIESDVQKELAEGFLAKPFLPDTLLNTVNSILH